LAKLLAEHRGVRNRKNLAALTEDRILQWAEAHKNHTGTWPHASSGPIVDAPGETWTAVELALSHGQRGLPGGSSLPRLLAQKLGVAIAANRPDLSVVQILAWADVS
jgi:hypothetical protein